MTATSKLGKTSAIGVALFLSVASPMVFAASMRASTEELTSIDQINGATTITFDSAASPIGFGIRRIRDIEERYQVRILGNPFLTSVLPEITGNASAPFSGQVLELRVAAPSTAPEVPTVVIIESTAELWQSIGASYISSNSTTNPTLRIRAYDAVGQLIGTVNRQFSIEPMPQVDPEAFNAAAFFLGISSEIPIRSVRIESLGGIGAIDNFTFSAMPTTVVPEPATAVLMIPVAIATLLQRTRYRRHRVGAIKPAVQTGC